MRFPRVLYLPRSLDHVPLLTEEIAKVISSNPNRQPLLSYLNDTLIRDRYASTLPFLSCTSSLTTSATLRSLNVLLARVMAAAVAFSQDSVLVPTSSMTLYTFSAMTIPPPFVKNNSKGVYTMAEANDHPGGCCDFSHEPARDRPCRRARSDARRAVPSGRRIAPWGHAI